MSFFTVRPPNFLKKAYLLQWGIPGMKMNNYITKYFLCFPCACLRLADGRILHFTELFSKKFLLPSGV